MMLLTVEEILALQEKVISQTGGSFGLRDRGLLESAVYSADSSFGDVEVYPSLEEKAARLAFAITGNHAFVDGNKRTGMLVMLLTLRLNGRTLRYTQAELVDLGLGTADGSLGYEEILAWIISHLDTKNPAGERQDCLRAGPWGGWRGTSVKPPFFSAGTGKRPRTGQAPSEAAPEARP